MCVSVVQVQVMAHDKHRHKHKHKHSARAERHAYRNRTEEERKHELENEKKRHKHRKYRFPRNNSRRKFAQVFLHQQDINHAIRHLRRQKGNDKKRPSRRMFEEDAELPPVDADADADDNDAAETEEEKKEREKKRSHKKKKPEERKHANRHKIRSFAHLLWRKQRVYELHVKRTPQLIFKQLGVVKDEVQVDEFEKEAIIKHLRDHTRPSADSPEFRFFEKRDEWTISVTPSTPTLIIKKDGEEVIPTKEEAANVIEYLEKRRQNMDENVPGFKYFEERRTFSRIWEEKTEGKDGNSKLCLKVQDGEWTREVVPAENINFVLTEAFEDIKRRTGPARLYRRLCETYIGIPRLAVREFLKKQITYQLHQTLRKPHTYHEIIKTKEPFQRWQADLIDLNSVKTGHQRFVLTVVDLFSKYAWARILPGQKSAENVQAALHDIITTEGTQKKNKDQADWKEAKDEFYMPEILQTDNGGEFAASEFDDMLNALWEKKGKSSKYTRNDQEMQNHETDRHVFSAAYKPTTQGAIERFNRTLKNMIFQDMTENKGLRVLQDPERGMQQSELAHERALEHDWVDRLPDFMANYNSNVSFSTGFKPIELHYHPAQKKSMNQAAQQKLEKRWAIARKRMEERQTRLKDKQRRSNSKYVQLVVGDIVRVSRMVFSRYRRDAAFRKGYLRNWSEAVFRIRDIKNYLPDDKVKEWAYYYLELVYDPVSETKLETWDEITENNKTIKVLKRRLYREDLQRLTPDAYKEWNEELKARLKEIEAQKARDKAQREASNKSQAEKRQKERQEREDRANGLIPLRRSERVQEQEQKQLEEELEAELKRREGDIADLENERVSESEQVVEILKKLHRFVLKIHDALEAHQLNDQERWRDTLNRLNNAYYHHCNLQVFNEWKALEPNLKNLTLLNGEPEELMDILGKVDRLSERVANGLHLNILDDEEGWQMRLEQLRQAYKTYQPWTTLGDADENAEHEGTTMEASRGCNARVRAGVRRSKDRGPEILAQVPHEITQIRNNSASRPDSPAKRNSTPSRK